MTEYPGLELRMKQLLGDRYGDPDANRVAFETDPHYRLIAEQELENAPWSAHLIEGVQQATCLARSYGAAEVALGL